MTRNQSPERFASTELTPVRKQTAPDVGRDHLSIISSASKAPIQQLA